jgi:C4-dicarboxylate transporter DctM subunit
LHLHHLEENFGEGIMSGVEAGFAGFTVLLFLLAIRMPIALAMIVVGLGGLLFVGSPKIMLNMLKNQMFYQYLNYDLSVIPLFLLMGQFASKAGFSTALFKAANAFLGHRKGGIAMAAVGGCAGFGAICGSSLATAAAMAQVALPELKRHNYSGALATGALAAGGTLGILIPPSIILVIAAVLTEGNIETLFQAALIPGIMAALGYILAIAIYVRIWPTEGPAGKRSSSEERIHSLLKIWPVLMIFIIVIGGIYAGIFTPTQGAAVGAAGTGLTAFILGGMRLKGFVESLLGTASTTAMIFLVLFGAGVLNSFLGYTGTPRLVASFISDSSVSPMLVLLIMIAIFVMLGCLMDSLSMILLLLPIFWPIILGLDFGMEVDDLRAWFCIIALIVVEIGLITPPVGLNVFIINSMADGVPMRESFIGVTPFLITDAIRVAALITLPGITLLLPHLLAR